MSVGSGAWWAGTGLLAALAVLTTTPEVAAQEQVDSTRLRILQQLELLARPPGYDSVLFRQDSLAQEEARVGLAGGGRGGPDSTLAQLGAMRGYTLTEYSGGRADFGAADRVLVLEASDGNRARVTRAGMEIQADSSITFDDATGRVRTVGGSTFTPASGDAVESARLVFDMAEERGSAFDARTEYSQAGTRWLVHGDMPFAAPDSTFMSHALFTSCDLTEPHYHFETDRIKIVGNNILVARPVRLYFADVPVAWLPFVVQSLSRGRASGLLTPRFSVNDIVRTSSGYRRRVSNLGFYWAMSDYSDALVAFDWFSNNFLSVTSSLQYRFNRQFLNGGLNFRRYWRNDGSTELALDTRHSWEFDERTQLRMSGRYASSNDFVRQNSFNPREVTQSIDSEGGLNRRFDWGSVALGANRKQYLSDDRTEWTLPSANVSLSSITLFRAPPGQARFWNNLTWAGGTNFNRRTVDRIQPDTFSFSQANTVKTSGGVRSRLSLGNFTLSQSMDLREASTLHVPVALLLPGDSAAPDLLLTAAPARDITQSDLTWSTSLGYQQQLIGSTTLTPRLSLNGRMFKADTSSLAPSFVSAPARVSLSADLKTDIYGFYPGVGGYEAIRHKISPSLSYSWSPEVEPTDLQRIVFGVRVLQPKSLLALTVNQTWEAKRAEPERPAADSAAAEADSLDASPGSGEPRRLPQAPIVNLLALRTSVLRYDFVEADSAGIFLAGFETTRLSNQISSDFLRGLSVNFAHDLLKDSVAGGQLDRKFAPHLSQVNLSFALGSGSSIFRWLGMLGGGGADEPASEPETEGAFDAQSVTDESSIIPGVGTPAPRGAQPTRRSGTAGGWNASLSYALQRPRGNVGTVSQMLSGTVTLRPTEQWNVSWRTAYDIERGAFNDHTIRLSRDLHRWEANFDFLQTATGNWSFRFEVSLIDNRDLKFDYRQRNIDVGLPPSRR